MAVFVLDKRKKPLMPCSEKRARLLLERNRAVVHKLKPFTIRLKDRIGGELQPVQLKLDPGSKTTGIAINRVDLNHNQHVLWLGELEHRGLSIRNTLLQRTSYRRNRRSKLRYRPTRFLNRTRPNGWLPPSLQHRVESVITWVRRLFRLTPITSIANELVKFNLSVTGIPELSHTPYNTCKEQEYETREYLLEKWNRKCAYCDATNTRLEIDHIAPKSKGGSDSISNLTLACRSCNQSKGNQPIEVFLQHDPIRLKHILTHTRHPLRDAAAVNTTRLHLYHQLKTLNVPVYNDSGARTKLNRHRNHIPKTHALDASCVGVVGTVSNWNIPTLTIRSQGRGRYQRTLSDKYGFPRGYLMKHKHIHGYKTGDYVKAIVTTGKKIGEYVGTVAVRATGSFNITTLHQIIQGISYRHCTLLQRSDGYTYSQQPKIATT